MNWKLGYTETADGIPSEYLPARVPSDVQLVWKEAKGLPDWNYGRNYLEYKWMEDVFWHYETAVEVEDKTGKTPILRFGGIDYRYTIYVDGNVEADSEGMYTPVYIDMTKYAGRRVGVKCLIHPVPKVAGRPDDRSQARESYKPPVSYGWDWHPRLVPSGLYEPVELRYEPKLRIVDNDLYYEVSEKLDSVKLTAKVKTTLTCTHGAALVLKLFDADGLLVAENTAPACDGQVSLDCPNPRLWWCRSQGEQYLYTCSVGLVDAGGLLRDTSRRRVGFRRVRLVMNADNWGTTGWPQTQAYFPITIELNGRRIFGKGSNYVPTEIFYSRMTRQVYYDTLKCALDCNMNLLRLWGGGLVNREPFFELCDEMGLMVWQEFTMSCNVYPDKPELLDVIEKESISVIKRLKSHPCVVLWCGGNELFNGWSGMTNQSHPLRLLDKLCYEYDRFTPYIMTSPLYGMGHGCYLAITREGNEGISDFVDVYRTAYTEFGSPSPAPFEYIRQYCPPDELYNVSADNCWRDHHAIDSWGPETWFRRSEIEAYYGPADTLEKTIENGLELQGESYKGMFEEARRRWPATSMAVNWCFNEPWPCFANNSLILYPAVKKPAWYVVRDALRDTMFSLRLHHLRLRRGEEVTVELFALNDLPDSVKGCSYRICTEFGGFAAELGAGRLDVFEPTSSKNLGKFSFTVPADAPDFFTLTVEASDPAYSSNYKLYCPFGD